MQFAKWGVNITLRVEIGLFSKKFVGSFGVDGLGWSLSLGVNRDLWKVQIKERDFDLTESIVKIVGKEDTKLLQKGVGVVILSYRVLLSLTEFTFCLRDLTFLIFKYFFQCLYLRLWLLKQLLCQVKLVNLDLLPSHQLSKLRLPCLNLLSQTAQHRLMGNIVVHQTFHHNQPLLESKKIC